MSSTSTPMSFAIKRNDTLPVLELTVTTSDSEPVDFTDATVVFHMYTDARPRVAKISSGVATVGTPETDGVLKYAFTSTNSTTAGNYLGEFQVTFSGGAVATFPTTGHIHITIEEDLL